MPRDDVDHLLRLARGADDEAHTLKLRAAGYVVAAVALGATWAEVGTAFGVTRQAAHERFSPAKRRRRRGTPVNEAALCDTARAKE